VSHLFSRLIAYYYIFSSHRYGHVAVHVQVLAGHPQDVVTPHGVDAPHGFFEGLDPV
jgi:hypothetical protein